jgi:hypothetical protein
METPASGTGVPEPPEPFESDLSCDLELASCGGDVVGAWHVVDCPLELTGEVNLAVFALGCVGGRITSGSLEVSGTWMVDANGNVVDDTTSKGMQQFELREECMSVTPPGTTCARLGEVVGMGLGYETLECVDDAGRGGCACTGSFVQQGGLADYEQCVLDDAMLMTRPSPSNVGRVVGSIVLQKE